MHVANIWDNEQLPFLCDSGYGLSRVGMCNDFNEGGESCPDRIFERHKYRTQCISTPEYANCHNLVWIQPRIRISWYNMGSSRNIAAPLELCNLKRWMLTPKLLGPVAECLLPRCTPSRKISPACIVAASRSYSSFSAYHI